jgi:hypothetical protein
MFNERPMKKIILNYLPNSFREMLRKAYYFFTVSIDPSMVDDLAEYYHISRADTLRLLRSAAQLDADFWNLMRPKTEEEIKRYYAINPFYVFDLVFWHATQKQRARRARFTELAAGQVLDYGGGVGDLCMMVAMKGLQVEYADIPGNIFNFARWQFEKYGCKIPMTNLLEKDILGKYGTMFCIDVIEHVLNPKEVLEKLVSHLEPGGLLFINNLDVQASDDSPMHFELGFDAEAYLHNLGMEKQNELFLWKKINPSS